ncbi:hypothetical protein GCM10029978_057020 [Actinoallomurus acanthiterrae]
MAVEFLTDEQAARYGVFYGVPTQTELEWFYLLHVVVTAIVTTGAEG